MIEDYVDFSEYCDKERCLSHTIFNKKTCKRENKRRNCFKKYLDKCNKERDNPIDKEWLAVREFVLDRDNFECRLAKVLSIEEGTGLRASFYQRQSLDVAHIVRRSQSTKLYYDPTNLVTLSRKYHSRLDMYKNPLTGKSATKEEIQNWWIRIVGKKTWNHLQNQR